MPKTRFYNLPIEKRERILKSAIVEFSRVPIHQVSINKIIKEAKISRGSFYQYFDDKNDLICEIISGYRDTLIANVKSHLANKDTDIFSLLIEVFEQIITFVEHTENQKLCFNLFESMRQDEKFFHTIVGQREIDDMVETIVSSVDTSKLKYSSREDIVNVLDIISAVGMKTVMKVIKHPDHKKDYVDSYKRQLMIIKTGIEV